MQDTALNRAIVARPTALRPSDGAYLMLGANGAAAWTTDPQAATAFESMREATRAALRLPSAVRAFGLPLRFELEAGSLH